LPENWLPLLLQFFTQTHPPSHSNLQLQTPRPVNPRTPSPLLMLPYIFNNSQ
jgi:hypothetical protein